MHVSKMKSLICLCSIKKNGNIDVIQFFINQNKKWKQHTSFLYLFNVDEIWQLLLCIVDIWHLYGRFLYGFVRLNSQVLVCFFFSNVIARNLHDTLLQLEIFNSMHLLYARRNYAKKQRVQDKAAIENK